MNICRLEEWGLIDYADARERQKTLFDLGIQQRKTGVNHGFVNHLITCEHPHVFTLGMNAGRENLLLSDEELKEKSIQCIKTERGGNITYHGPGQILVYPILNLKDFDIYIKDYVWKLEELIIRSINEFGILGYRLDNAPGVWVNSSIGLPQKIAAIGVRSSRFITMHGFALNVNTEMDYFQMINPCGFTSDSVCSMQEFLPSSVNLVEVKMHIFRHFENLFGLKLA
jgi:lipoyl(octanoyl) transferase